MLKKLAHSTSLVSKEKSTNTLEGAIKDKPYLDLERYRIRPTDHFEPPIRMLTQTINGKLYTIGTLGNISMVIGKAKARKSFLINMMMTTALGDGVSYGMFQCDAPPDKRGVLYLDTEQSKDMVWRAIKRVSTQLDVAEPNLETFALRSINPRERLEVIERAINESDGIGLVIIDGISDLVSSINDEEQSTNVSTILMRLSEEHHIHIMTVLHTNKNDSNARGHLGTYFQNKAETTIEIAVNEIDKDVSNVEAKYSRSEEITPFAIRINGDGLPIIEENFGGVVKEKKPKKGAISNEAFWEILNYVFIPNQGQKKVLIYSDFVKEFQAGYLKKMGDTVGIGITKSLIMRATMEGYVEKEVRELYPVYTLAPINPIGTHRFEPPS